MSNFYIMWLRVENIGSGKEDLEGWKNFHAEELHNLDLSPDIITAIQDGHIQEEMAGEVTYLSIQCQSHPEQGFIV
jgi:hypothetical protein